MKLHWMTRIFLLQSILLYSNNLYPQLLSDTIHISEVIIKGEGVFKKEEAGIKTTKVDSMVMIDKINVSLSNILSENTTVFIKDHGRGALATASFRGTAPSHTQVFWNGIMINSPMLGMTDFSLIPAFIIDDLELNHSAASLSTGSGGLGGSISIKNSPDWDNTFSWRYFQGVGSYSTYDEFLQLNAGNKKFQSKTRLYHNFSENDYQYVNKAILERPLVKNENAAYMKKGFTQELYFRLGDENIFTMKVWGQFSDRSLPSVMSYEGDDQSNMNNQIDTTIKFSADWTFYKGNIKLTARSGVDYQQTGYTLLNRVGGVGLVPAIDCKSSALSWYNHFGIHYDFTKRLTCKAYFDYNRFNVETYESVMETGYDRARNDFSLFGGTFYNLSKWLNMSLILRQEYCNYKFSPLLFNIGATISPLNGGDLILKANYSKNFHNPTLNDLYWQPGGNPGLLPEVSHSGEFSAEYYLNAGGLKIEQVLTPYYSETNDWIIWLPSFQGYWRPFNLEKVKSYGLEYHLKFVKNIGEFEVQLHGNYAITKSINCSDGLFFGDGSYGKQLPFIPVHSGNMLVSVSYNGYYVRFQNNSYSERFTLSSNEVGTMDDSEDIGAGISTNKLHWYYPYFMNNLTIGKDISFRKFNLGIDCKIYNLFGEVYRSVLGRYMPGRNYELTLKISYNKL